MRLHDELAPRGDLEVGVYKSGLLLDWWEDKNLIIDGAREMLAHLIAGDGDGRAVTHIGFGTSATPPTPGDTSLTGAYWRELTGHTYPEAGKVRFSFVLSTTEANGLTIREFGLRTSNGALFSRKARGAIEKNDDISLEGTWTITL
jgi:hypothetical protein